MMNIAEALKTKHRNVRVSCGERWLVWNEAFSVWEVYSRKYAQKKTRTLATTGDEALAVKYLLYQGEL